MPDFQHISIWTGSFYELRHEYKSDRDTGTEMIWTVYNDFNKI